MAASGRRRSVGDLSNSPHFRLESLGAFSLILGTMKVSSVSVSLNFRLPAPLPFQRWQFLHT